jgi:hypothetical protein
VSCSSATSCVAVDGNGNVVTTTNPTGGASAWTTSDAAGSADMTAVACPSASLCVAVDYGGDVITGP